MSARRIEELLIRSADCKCEKNIFLSHRERPEMQKPCSACGRQCELKCETCGTPLCSERCSKTAWISPSSCHRKVTTDASAMVGDLFTLMHNATEGERTRRFVVLPAKTTLFHGTVVPFEFESLAPWSWFAANLNPSLGMILSRHSRETGRKKPRVYEVETLAPLRFLFFDEKPDDVAVNFSYNQLLQTEYAGVPPESVAGIAHPVKRPGRNDEDELRIRHKPGEVLRLVRTYELSGGWLDRFGDLFMGHVAWDSDVDPREPPPLLSMDERVVVVRFRGASDRILAYSLLRQFCGRAATGNVVLSSAGHAVVAMTAYESPRMQCAVAFDAATPPGFDPMPGTAVLDAAAISPSKWATRFRALAIAAWMTSAPDSPIDGFSNALVVVGFGTVPEGGEEGERRGILASARGLLLDYLCSELWTLVPAGSSSARLIGPEEVAKQMVAKRKEFMFYRQSKADHFLLAADQMSGEMSCDAGIHGRALPRPVGATVQRRCCKFAEDDPQGQTCGQTRTAPYFVNSLKKLGTGLFTAEERARAYGFSHEFDLFERNPNATGLDVGRYAVRRFEEASRSAAREMIILRNLRHPATGACRAVRLSEEQGSGYAILSDVATGRLTQRLNNFLPTFDVEEKLDVSFQVLMCVAYLHSVGVAHRDIDRDHFLYNDAGDRTIIVSDLRYAHSLYFGGALDWEGLPPAYPIRRNGKASAISAAAAADAWQCGRLLWEIWCETTAADLADPPPPTAKTNFGAYAAAMVRRFEISDPSGLPAGAQTDPQWLNALGESPTDGKASFWRRLQAMNAPKGVEEVIRGLMHFNVEERMSPSQALANSVFAGPRESRQPLFADIGVPRRVALRRSACATALRKQPVVPADKLSAWPLEPLALFKRIAKHASFLWQKCSDMRGDAFYCDVVEPAMYLAVRLVYAGPTMYTAYRASKEAFLVRLSLSRSEDEAFRGLFVSRFVEEGASEEKEAKELFRVLSAIDFDVARPSIGTFALQLIDDDMEDLLRARGQFMKDLVLNAMRVYASPNALAKYAVPVLAAYAFRRTISAPLFAAVADQLLDGVARDGKLWTHLSDAQWALVAKDVEDGGDQDACAFDFVSAITTPTTTK